MLKNISLHIAEDKTQTDIENRLASVMQKTNSENINAFQRYIPSLMPLLNHGHSANISILCNKDEQFNIIDIGLGRTFYGLDPDAELGQQFDTFTTHAPKMSLVTTENPETSDSGISKTSINSPTAIGGNVETLFHNLLKFPAIPSSVDCVVVFGCGLGKHIEMLINRVDIGHIVVYEPEIQYFMCSTKVLQWKALLETAHQKKTAIYLQLGKDGRDLVQDIEQLKSNFGVSEFYYYKHYNHEIFDSICTSLNELNWQQLYDRGIKFKKHHNVDDYAPPWSITPTIKGLICLDKSDLKLKKNLSAFKKYFPEIYEKFKDYSPTEWIPVKHQSNGEINVINTSLLVSWYTDSPKNDCLLNLESFAEKPNKDGLQLGYSGKKLKHYLHYKFVAQAESLLNEVEEEYGSLPHKIQSIILFGIGVGYQLEALYQNHTIENMFISEPNTDFFYSSLFALDWHQILHNLDEAGHRIYINIGDDGTNLFKDLVNQFYSIGPYILNNTYFYSGYYNSRLKSATAQLREQLKLVISMGEYFDHAYYGITQTQHGIRHNFPYLKKAAQKYLSLEDKEVPVFLLGNGPSLDHSIDFIKEMREQIIVVSCGTSLQVLYKHDITPDFHAEIEQNRTTYDWATLIGAPEYLKKITLISCNGVHPDTATLYKDVLIAFKEGESSTVSTETIIGQDTAEILQFSFPTVSNFASNLFIKLSMNSIYLMGIDLGFIDSSRHHSKLSGYYDHKGNEVFDYAKTVNTSLVVPGNFRKTVQTKDEFKIANMLLEQSIAASSKDCNIYNCSDGALIKGATPLNPELILINSDADRKQQAIKRIKNEAFGVLNLKDYQSKFGKRYSNELIERELDHFKTVLSDDIEDLDQAKALINQLKETLFSSYSNGRSLLFYYFFGSVNFANAFLTKLIYSSQSNGVELFNRGLQIFRDAFDQFSQQIKSNPPRFDASNYNRNIRQLMALSNKSVDRSIVLFCNDARIAELFKTELELTYCWPAKVEIVVYQQLNDLHKLQFKAADYVLYCDVEDTKEKTPRLSTQPEIDNLPFHGKTGTTIVTGQLSDNALRKHVESDNGVTVVIVPQDKSDVTLSAWIDHAPFITRQLLMHCFSTAQRRLILPKTMVKERLIDDYISPLWNVFLDEDWRYVDFERCIYVYRAVDGFLDLINDNGDRGEVLPVVPSVRQRISHTLTDDEYQNILPKWEPGTMINTDFMKTCNIKLVELT